MRFLVAVLAASIVAVPGCVDRFVTDPVDLAGEGVDVPVALPPLEFYDRPGHPSYFAWEGEAIPFHTLEELDARIEAWTRERPDLVTASEIGRSLEGRPLRLVTVTGKPALEPKPVVLLDGGHHANELAGTEMCFFLVDFLIHNYGQNATITQLLDGLELHVVPLLNPDGYVRQTRGNALGVNLNRNYDVDWGNPGGASNLLMGTLAHATNRSMPSVPIVAENSGPHAFSEPESIAMRDHMARVSDRLAAYLTHHTPTNGFISPWAAFDAPFPIPPAHDAVFEATLAWVRGNTEYKAGKAQWGNFTAGLPYSASGSSMDWAYAQHGVASFTLELEIWYLSIFSDDYAQRYYLTPYPGLVYWLKSALPIDLFMLVNAHNFREWTLPTTAPPLPEGVPPRAPPSGAPLCPAIPRDEAPGRAAVPYPVACAPHAGVTTVDFHH